VTPSAGELRAQRPRSRPIPRGDRSARGRPGLLSAIRELATAAIPAADQRARDRDLDDVQRKRWSAARRDLEAIADEPERILAAPFATRIAAWPEQLDEPAPKPEPTLAELIELD